MAMDLQGIDPRSGFCWCNGIFYSKRTSLALPHDPFLTLPSFLLHHSTAFHHHISYIDASTGHRITYGDLHLQIQAAAAGLAQFGVRQGDVLLLLSHNSVRFAVVVLAVMSIGAVVTTTNPANRPAEIAKQASDSGAKFVATTPALLEKITPLKLPLILMDHKEGTSPAQTFRCIAFVDLISADPNTRPKPQARQEDIAAILYSSGTTGASKGVMLTHRNMIAQAVFFMNRTAGMPWSSRVYLCLVPMFHAYGLAIFCSAVLTRGCPIVLLPKYDTVQMLASIEKYRVTHLPIVPPILQALANSSSVENYDLSPLAQVSCGAAPVSHGVIAAFTARFPNVKIMQAYGLTESTAVAANAITEEESQHSRSTGLLAPNTEAKIVDTDFGKPLPPNSHGEIWLRGPTIMQGYLGRPEETAATVDEEGWLHTGDLGYIDADGYLFVVDRLKELIKYKGYQVAPAELEAVLLTHPQILDAAVVPCPDDKAGQIPMAYVVKAHGSAIMEVDVIDFVAEQVAPYKKIRRVAMVNTIPKSPSGKILRRQLVMKAASRL